LRPRHLRATVQPFGAEQQHDCLQIHADVGPLGPAQVAVDVAEQGRRRAETVPVGDGRPLARLPVLARNAERAVALLAEGGSAVPVRRLQRARIHLVLPLVPRVAVGHALNGVRLELGQPRAGQHVDLPRLDVRSGRRPSRGGQHTLQHLPRHRLVFESAHRPSACDCLIYVHDRLPTAGHSFRSNAVVQVGPHPTSGQYSQGPGTQRKTSPSTATWQTDGNDRWVATSDSRFAASSRRRRTRTRAASSGSCSKPLYQSGCSNPTWNTASPANVSRSPPDGRRTTLCPGVWPPVRVTSTPGATSYSFSNGRIWLWYSFKNRLPVRRSASGNPGGMETREKSGASQNLASAVARWTRRS